MRNFTVVPDRTIAERNRRAYKREWMRRQRDSQRRNRHQVGSLHDLACGGPTRATGCRCRKIPVYRVEP